MRARYLVLALAAACGDGGSEAPPPEPPKTAPRVSPGLPDRVTYDQILIVFKGSYERMESGRTREEARTLAYSILERVQSGVDFETLKQEFSDDRNVRSGVALGPYESVKDGLRREGGEIPLGNLHKGLAELVYRLKVGEIGIVDFDEVRFPIGWMVAKRLK